MSTDVGSIIKAIFGAAPSLSLLTGSAQTMLSWSKVIESYDDVPEVYKGFFKTLLGDSKTFPHVVLTPALDRFLHKTPERLVCDVNDTIYVVERDNNQIIARGYPVKAIRDVEVGEVLLRSWITINGVTIDGFSTSSTMEFNSANSGRFTSFLKRMRPVSSDSDDTKLSAEQDKFNYLDTQNFKFMNYARNSLVHGEKVIYTLWQPEIREAIVTLLGRPFYRTISTAHFTILTDKEIIIIRDDERVEESKGIRHGGIWHYIPLRNIVSLSVKPTNNLLTLSLNLSNNGHLDRIFAVSNKQELENLQNETKKLMGK